VKRGDEKLNCKNKKKRKKIREEEEDKAAEQKKKEKQEKLNALKEKRMQELQKQAGEGVAVDWSLFEGEEIDDLDEDS